MTSTIRIVFVHEFAYDFCAVECTVHCTRGEAPLPMVQRITSKATGMPVTLATLAEHEIDPCSADDILTTLHDHAAEEWATRLDALREAREAMARGEL